MGCFKADKAEPVNYSNQLGQTLNAQQSVAPQQLALEQQYQPQYAQLAAQNYASMFNTMQGNAATGLPAAADAVRSISPESQRLLSLLNSQAQTGLEAGTGLTPEQTRMAQQSSRAASAARGMSNSNSALFDETYRQFDMGNQLQTQRQATAGQVLGLNQSQVDNPALALYGSTGAGASQLLAQAGPALFNPESNLSAQITSGNSAADQFYNYNNRSGSTVGQITSSY